MKTPREVIAEALGWESRYADGDAKIVLSILDKYGYVILPKEPTPEMIDAGTTDLAFAVGHAPKSSLIWNPKIIYCAMIAAAQKGQEDGHST